MSGGVFNSTIQISFFSETSETEKMKAVADSVTIRGGVSVSGPQVGVSGAVEHSTSKVDASKSSHSTTTETYSTQHHIKTIGPQVLEFVAFHNALTHNNKAHCLVSNGFDMGDPTTWANKSIWEIALEAPELSQFAGRFKVAQLLRNAWLKMVLESSGPHLETFMSTMVSQTLNHNIRDNALEVDIDTEKWAEPWRIKLGIRQVTDESDPFTVPVNVWCVLASDLGTVLDIPYGEARDGSRLWMQNLNDRPSQYWKFTPEGYIENFLGNVVIQIGEKDSLTLRHKTEEEDKNSAQKFYFNNLRQLVTHVDSQLCIDVKGANSAGGATVFCSKPHNGSNQKWRFFPVDPTPYPQALSVWCHITSDKGNVKFDLNYDGGTSKRRSFQFTHTANDKIWKLNPDGSIESELEKDVGGVSQELVLDVKNGNVAEGAWLYPKNHSGAQKWFFTIDKELVPYADTTTCLEWFRDDSNKKVTCFFSKRSGSPKQRWEFSPCAPALMATK